MTTTPVKTLGFCGSLRKASYNRMLLRTAIELAPEGMVIEVAEIDGLPVYNADLHQAGLTAQVERLCDQTAAADALLFAAPEYNHSIAAPLKNAIDWISRRQPQPFAGKPAAIMGATQGLYGTVRSQMHLRHSMVFLDMHPLNKPEVLIGQAQNKFDAEGRLTDETARGLVRDLMAALKAWTIKLRG
jgi:chromate reductase